MYYGFIVKSVLFTQGTGLSCKNILVTNAMDLCPKAQIHHFYSQGVWRHPFNALLPSPILGLQTKMFPT